MIRHHFTVDVEEYFQVSALEPVVPREEWGGMESRVGASVDRLLELLAGGGATATFFVLGWLADRRPDLVRRIAAGGHEIASHGFGHHRVSTLTPERFRESVRRSKASLEAITGVPVLGYRAPSFSITRGMDWALQILVEEGYRYDSSLFPVRRRGYGYAGGRREPHDIALPAGRLREFPPTTLRVGPAVLPAAGGAYFRLFPYTMVAAGLRQAERSGHPGTFYIHPWELDPDQPRMAVGPVTRVRHYGKLARTEPRIRRLLGEFRFESIGSGMGAAAPARDSARPSGSAANA